MVDELSAAVDSKRTTHILHDKQSCEHLGNWVTSRAAKRRKEIRRKRKSRKGQSCQFRYMTTTRAPKTSTYARGTLLSPQAGSETENRTRRVELDPCSAHAYLYCIQEGEKAPGNGRGRLGARVKILFSYPIVIFQLDSPMWRYSSADSQNRLREVTSRLRLTGGCHRASAGSSKERLHGYPKASNRVGLE